MLNIFSLSTDAPAAYKKRVGAAVDKSISGVFTHKSSLFNILTYCNISIIMEIF